VKVRHAHSWRSGSGNKGRETMIAIHPIHRKMAEIIHMSMDRNGNIAISPVELTLLLPLLRQNLELVRRIDELKELSFQAYLVGDTEWQHEICRQLDALEAKMK